MTLGTPPSPEQIEADGQSPPPRRHRLVRSVLLLVGGLVSFGFLMFVLAGNADAATTSDSAPANTGAANPEDGQPVLGQLLSLAQTPVSQPLNQIAAAVASATTPLAHTVNTVTAPLVTPLVHQVSGVLTATVEPVTAVLKPVTGPLLDALSPVMRPVTTGLGVQPLVSALGGSTRPAAPVEPVANGSGNAVTATTQSAMIAPTAASTSVHTATAATLATSVKVARQVVRLPPTAGVSTPVVPGRTPVSPIQSSALPVTGTDSFASGSGSGHSTGNAVADGHAVDSWSAVRWPVWSSRGCARGSCFVHGRDHPR